MDPQEPIVRRHRQGPVGTHHSRLGDPLQIDKRLGVPASIATPGQPNDPATRLGPVRDPLLQAKSPASVLKKPTTWSPEILYRSFPSGENHQSAPPHSPLLKPMS